jgi:hypothetical protein
MMKTVLNAAGDRSELLQVANSRMITTLCDRRTKINPSSLDTVDE